MRKIVVIGVLFGLLVSGLVFSEYLLKMHTENYSLGQYMDYVRYGLFLLAILIILLLVKGAIENASKIFLKYLLSSSFTMLIIAILVSMSHAVYHGVVNPNYEYEFREYWLGSTMNDSSLSDTHKQMLKSQLIVNLKQYDWMMSPWGSAFYYFIETIVVSLVMCLLLSIIFSLIFKPKEKSVVDGG